MFFYCSVVLLILGHLLRCVKIPDSSELKHHQPSEISALWF